MFLKEKLVLWLHMQKMLWSNWAWHKCKWCCLSKMWKYSSSKVSNYQFHHFRVMVFLWFFRPDYQLYRCQNSDCDNEVESVEISDLEQKLESRLEQCQGSNVEDLENLLKDFSKKLSEKHFLVLLLKRKMIGALKLSNNNVTREGLSR